jgi:IclR family acetate operon transcriptional repressor
MVAKIIPGPGGAGRSKSTRTADRHSIQSVDRALLLLETIAEMGGEATLTELAARAGLNISTCHHLLATLIKRNFATKVPGRRLYALGGRIMHLGHACLQVDLPRRAQPYIERINRETGETVHLAALQGEAIVVLACREARHAVRVETAKLGKIPAPHAQSIGKSILAWLPENEIHRLLADGMKRYTPETVTDFPALIESLRQIRRSGFAFDREEYLPGVYCIGAAIRDQNGTVVGAISASMPSMRANDEHVARVRDEVLAGARALSAEFGAQPAAQQPQVIEAVAG